MSPLKTKHEGGILRGESQSSQRTRLHGPTEYLLPGNQLKAGLTFALFSFVINEILVKDSLNYSKQRIPCEEWNAITWIHSITGFVCKEAALLFGAILQYFRDNTVLHLTIISECQVYSKDGSPPPMMKATEVAEIKAASCCLFFSSNSDL